MEFFIHNNFFSNFQYGFISGRSTSIQLMKFLDYLTSCLDDGGQIDIIYTDFEKAFDKVPHGCLISKLHSYGIPDSLIRWIESFLCFKKKQIKINKYFSDSRPVLSGIPQGSVLGPLLFNTFIIDQPDVCERLCRIFLFADDAKLYRHVREREDHLALQGGCQSVFDWSRQWNISLNVAECKVLTVAKNKNFVHKFDYGFATGLHTVVCLENVA